MDKDLVTQWYREHGQSVYRRALNILRSEQEALEAMRTTNTVVETKL